MDSQGRLVLRFDDDGDGTGKLLVQANSNGFCGKGSAWFSGATIQDFADAIAVFPIPEEKSPKIAGGFYKKDGSGEFAQEHFALTVYPIDHRGHIGFQVRIATELWNEERPESQQEVKLEIITSYEPLAQFSRQLKALVEGRIKEVILDADLLP